MKQATITNLMQLIEQHVPAKHHDMIRHSIEFAYCDGKIDGIRELAREWAGQGANPNPMLCFNVSGGPMAGTVDAVERRQRQIEMLK